MQFKDANENIISNYLINRKESSDLYKLNTSAYVAGYIARKLEKKYNCEICKNDLIDSNKTLSGSTMFLFFKEYDNVTKGLCYPTDQFIESINYFGESFAELFRKATHYSKISEYIVSELLNFNLNFLTCNMHKTCLQEDLVKMYVSLMIYYKLKYISNSLNNSKRNAKKIKKLS